MSDGVIALAYYSIPLTICYFLVRSRDRPMGWPLALSAAFILLCGTTHLMDIWILWHADYVAQGLLKMTTAFVSLLTATYLWPLVPTVLRLPSPTALLNANQALLDEAQARSALLTELESERSKREQTAAMLRQAQKMEAFGQLTGGVAHDFNNLLMVIMGNLEMICSNEALPQDLMMQAERALASVHRGSALTGQLLAFARQQPLDAHAFDLNARILDMVVILSTTLGSRSKVLLNLAEDAWTVHADPNQVDSALLNLALNARDAMPDGGCLTIATFNEAFHPGPAELRRDAMPGDYVGLSVSDTGTGMPEKILHAALEPFFTTKPIGKGSGLGLSQIHGFVHQSNGHMSLESEVGVGTTVTLYLRRSALVPSDESARRAQEVTAAAD